MNCPICGGKVERNRRFCDQCGADVVVTARLVRLSNHFYNEGLRKAEIRDLSGAVVMLKKSLEYKKSNIQARNLLGLCYFELGETVLALSEWIISKHFQSEDNLANYFIDKVQADTVKLDEMNQTIRKFNLALEYAKKGSDDLAKMQLRKVITAAPSFVKGLQLLALLYMKEGEYEKAKRCLTRAKSCDVANTTTLTYLAEIDVQMNTGTKAHEEEPLNVERSYHVAPPTVKLSEDKPNYIAFLTFFAGILIGIAVLYFLVVPTVRANVKEEYLAEERDYAAEIGTYTTNISVLESEKTELSDKLERLKEELAEVRSQNEEYAKFDAKSYEEFLEVLGTYPKMISRVEEARRNEDMETILAEKIAYMDILVSYNEVAQKRETTAAIYRDMLEPLREQIRTEAYDYGRELYDAKEYEEAIPYFEAVLRTEQTSDDTLYFLARCFHKLSRKEEAVVYYQMLVEQYPDSDRYNTAKKAIDSLTEE